MHVESCVQGNDIREVGDAMRVVQRPTQRVLTLVADRPLKRDSRVQDLSEEPHARKWSN